jgi:hypothetical protein
MTAPDDDRTASLMTPAKLAQLKVRPAPAASAADWLDQMAADAGSGHVRRLMDLRQQLEALVRGREGDFRAVTSACQSLHDALGRLDFDLVQPKGWLARATGKGKEALATFASQHRQVHEAGDDLADEVRDLQKKQAVQGSASDKTVLEIEAETRAVEKIMDQGARWLQDMRNQLKARQSAGGDAAVQQQIEQDNARCELLVTRLKLLRAVNTAGQQALERCKGSGARRETVLASLQQLLDTEWKAAALRVERLADEAGGAAADEGVAKAQRACSDARAALQQAAQDCASAQAGEQAAADELAAFRVPLDAAA